jgi:hypothetical protein
MKRGEIWTLQADGYASKPRPVVIVQNDSIGGFDSVVTCLLKLMWQSFSYLFPRSVMPALAGGCGNLQNHDSRDVTGGLPSCRLGRLLGSEYHRYDVGCV